MTTVKSIVFAFADSTSEWNTSEWRSRTPSDALNGSGRYVGRCIPISDFAKYNHPSIIDIVGAADVIVVQRNLLSKDVWEACDYWRGVGKLVVGDLDDDYPHLLPQNPAYNFWIKDKLDLKGRTGYTPIEALTEGFRHLDALVSPNRHILDDWAEIVPGYWLPNYARWEWWKKIRQKPVPAFEDKIVIGWGGSVSHFDGWWFSGLREAIPAITDAYPTVWWKICGSDQRIKDLFDKLAPDRWIDQAGVPPDKWPLQVASFDIGLAPLCGPDSEQGQRYDSRRSWLKAIEYILAGAPWIASDGGVYEELDGKGGVVIENTAAAWIKAITIMINELPEHKIASKKLMRWGRDNLTIEHQIDDYVRVFDHIYADHHARHNIRLPNVFYAIDQFDNTEAVEVERIQVADDDNLMMLTEIQELTFDAVADWTKVLDIHGHGVDLGDCLKFPLLGDLNARVFAEVTK